MFEVRKRQNLHYDYSAMRRGQKAPIFSTIEMEQDEIDFRSEDPRRKRIDATMKKKLELIMKMKMNQKYNQVKDSLWKKSSSPTVIEKIQLLKEKHKLETVQKSEKEFMDNLKDTISSRYRVLQDSFDNQFLIEKGKNEKIKQKQEVEERSKGKKAVYNNFTSVSPQSFDYPIESGEATGQRRNQKQS